MIKKYYGQFNPPFDSILEKYYLSDIKNGIGIECGAFDGVLESNLKFFEEQYNWKIYNIEACPPIFEKLKINRPNSLNFNVALSNKNYIQNFKHIYHPIRKDNFGHGSLTHNQEHLDKLLNINCIIKEYSIPCTTFSNFILENNITKVNCFVLDVEAHEIEVIEGMKDCKVLPDVLMIENSFISTNKLNDKINEILPNEYKYDNQFHNSAFYRKL